MIKPTFNNVVLTQAEQKTTTESGIILQGRADASSVPGKVEAIGPDVTSVAVGDTVYVKWKDSLPVMLGSKMAVIIEETAIMGVAPE